VSSESNGKMAFSPDGTILAAAPHNKTVYLWDVNTGKRIRQLHGHRRGILKVAFSSDGKQIAASAGCFSFEAQAGDNTVRIWDRSTGKQLLVLDGYTSFVTSVAFSSDGRAVASGGANGVVRVWELSTGQELLRFSSDESVHDIVFSPDGRLVASALDDGTALIWDIALKDRRDSVKELTPQGWKQGWKDLASEDAAKAYRAVCTLAGTPVDTVPALKENLHRVPLLKSERLDQLIADLDSDTFARREAASRELSRLGTVAESALRKALENSPSAELRRRAKPLLAALPGWVIKDPDTQRVVRAIWVLQRIANPKARALLEQLAAGAPAARQTQEAKAALQYLERIKKR
jgi:hypothetical protein